MIPLKSCLTRIHFHGMSGKEIILFFANPNSEFGFAKNKAFVHTHGLGIHFD